MTQPSRRDFLKLAAMLSGAASVSGVVPDSIQRAFAIEPAPGSTYMDAEHIVILMQENRSFDHALGTLQGVRGFNDPRALQLANGNSVFVQTNNAGASYAPWRLDIKDTRITWMGSVPHTRHSQVDAWNYGLHNNWIEAKRPYEAQYKNIPLTMGHYTREDIPFYYALADAFTVCDQSYCAVMSSTTPNRCMFWTGTIRDQQRADSRVFMRNDEILIGGMKWKTYPERLHEAGISWKFYQNELTNAGGLSREENAWLSNFGCNIFEYFAAYNVEAYPSYSLYVQEQLALQTKRIARLQQQLSTETNPLRIEQQRSQLKQANNDLEVLHASLASTGESRYKELTPDQRLLHNAAFVTNRNDPSYRSLATLDFDDPTQTQHQQQQMQVPKGDILHQFRQDVDNGKLPTISWLSAPETFSDHPTSPWYGAWYVSEVMDILTKNPEVWKKTIFILTYDENDGYFDHAPSFVAPDPQRPETGGASAGIDTALEYTTAEDEIRMGVPASDARSGPIGMGFRIPTIVASPWSRGGWVNSQLFDHTSTLMFLEEFVQKKFGKTVREENISDWRRAISGDLTSCFRPYDAKEPTLNYLDRDKFVVSIQQARYKEVPANFQQLTQAQIDDINTNLLHSPHTSHQEQGIRPASSIPYELYAHGNLSPDGTTFNLLLKAGNEVHGAHSAGAPFNVYLRNTHAKASMMAATYAVKPGDTLTEHFPLSLFADANYSIEVHGPNGFYRSFKGSAQAPAPQAHIAYEQHHARPTGNIQLQLSNPSQQPLTVSVRDRSYKTGTITKTIPATQAVSIVLPLTNSHNWYDFTVQTEGSTAEAHFAGHVDTGHSSFTDPLMGGIA
jgi:phospholipase C